MKMKLLALVLGLQVCWVLATVTTQELNLHSAPTVLLETRPVDPRDMLRGDFVILSYEISQLSLSRFQPPLQKAPPPGQTVYVTLEPHGQFHEAVSASLQQPASRSGQVVIRGTTEHSWGGTAANPVVRVRYGLERYYVAEGTGNPRGKLSVRAAVPASGQATIKDLFVDGKPYREAMREQK